MPIVAELQQYTSDVDASWMTRRYDHRSSGPVWITLPFAKNGRGDSIRAESNYRVIQADLDRVSAFGTDYRVDLWPGGTIETLMVRADDALALRAADEWIAHIESEGVASESDYSELEAEETRAAYGQWLYSDMYSSLPEWWQEACDELDPSVVEESFFDAVAESGEQLSWAESDGIAWDWKRATEILQEVIRAETRKRLGRV
jgi:hypothetical protein